MNRATKLTLPEHRAVPNVKRGFWKLAPTRRAAALRLHILAQRSTVPMAPDHGLRARVRSSWDPGPEVVVQGVQNISHGCKCGNLEAAAACRPVPSTTGS